LPPLLASNVDETVTLAYFDSSAFVKLLVDEGESSDLASDLWDGSDAVLSSRLAYPEVRAALGAAARNHDMTDRGLADAERAWDGYWAATRPVELTRLVEQHAGQLARDHALRGADAVHLASALAVGDTDLIVAVWDLRLHAGARAANLSVLPAHPDA
jgi:predicted nucleic acid-binding protein